MLRFVMSFAIRYQVLDCWVSCYRYATLTRTTQPCI